MLELLFDELAVFVVVAMDSVLLDFVDCSGVGYRDKPIVLADPRDEPDDDADDDDVRSE